MGASALAFVNPAQISAFPFLLSAFLQQPPRIWNQPKAITHQPPAQLAQTILDKERRMADIGSNIKGRVAHSK